MAGAGKLVNAHRCATQDTGHRPVVPGKSRKYPAINSRPLFKAVQLHLFESPGQQTTRPPPPPPPEDGM